jgi:hypothetical protein
MRASAMKLGELACMAGSYSRLELKTRFVGRNDKIFSQSVVDSAAAWTSAAPKMRIIVVIAANNTTTAMISTQ